uniref:Uncharacterized protein n=1 Tax=Amphimedon queenslandica TaxID=400682 RepID=A0A1X7TVC2_AMPQE
MADRSAQKLEVSVAFIKEKEGGEDSERLRRKKEGGEDSEHLRRKKAGGEDSERLRRKKEGGEDSERFVAVSKEALEDLFIYIMPKNSALNSHLFKNLILCQILTREIFFFHH